MSDPILKSVQVQNFRCFGELAIDQLTRINLIAGRNSVGKTAILEAIFLLIGAENLSLTLTISQFRGIRDLKGDVSSILELLWAPLFFNLHTDREITIQATLNNAEEQRVELRLLRSSSRVVELGLDSGRPPNHLSSDHVLQEKFTDAQGHVSEFEMLFAEGELRIQPVPAEPPFKGFFLTARRAPQQQELAELFGRLAKSKTLEQFDLVEILRCVEPRLQGLDIIPSAGSSMIYGDVGLDQMLPISIMGDGLERILGILLRIANAAGGVVLIDEIENGLHHSILGKVWEVIGLASTKFNTQVIATTHSFECIREAHLALKQTAGYEFLLHRLDRIGDAIAVETYDEELLAAAINAQFEVR